MYESQNPSVNTLSFCIRYEDLNQKRLDQLSNISLPNNGDSEVITEHSFCPADTSSEATFLDFLCLSSFELTDLNFPPSVGTNCFLNHLGYR